MASRRSPSEVAAVQRLLDWAESNGLETKWGRGSKYGSFSPKFRIGDAVGHTFSLYSDNNVQVPFAAMKIAPFDLTENRRELARRLEAALPGTQIPDDRLEAWPFCGIGALNDRNVEAFVAVWDWFLAEVSDLPSTEPDLE